jgi:hypothetical protein
MVLNRQLFAGILITIIYWASYQGFEGFHLLKRMNSLFVSGLIFFLLFLTAVVGAFGLYKNEKKWLLNVWIRIYSIVIFCCLGITPVLLLVLKVRNSSFIDFISSLRMFFTSPVPYAVLLFLGKRF